MVGQRWGQRARDLVRRARRLPGLAGAAVLVLALGCGGAPRDPTGLGGGGGGGGSGGGGGGTGVLIGEWENILLIDLTSDIQRITTTWTFTDAGDCRRVVETYSVLEDREITTTRDCTYQATGNTVEVLYDDATEPVAFRYSLAGFSPDRLVLGGFEFTRVS